MDRATERKERIKDTLVPEAQRIWKEEREKSKYYGVENLKFDLAKLARKTWMISEPVARDYAGMAIALAFKS